MEKCSQKIIQKLFSEDENISIDFYLDRAVKREQSKQQVIKSKKICTARQNVSCTNNNTSGCIEFQTMNPFQFIAFIVSGCCMLIASLLGVCSFLLLLLIAC